ncbi:Gfo/Idh/MocA family oxidoreductase [Plantibacter sp. MCCC 1A11337]|uniref:Gfo/Idh/MocA family protein n=1 Tax=Plantibacter sp. MCCC 1A11337 TaxID=2736644 RepID=UPI0015831754|nr:Gfo/Idh/MocA family oxidoreductase [Plantibacter sp. MCCC 1A11337]NUJ88124.1 Gfo/Idh/MocA family oxidoreductase [Plantibacter sp. MCCC 1A11337]
MSAPVDGGFATLADAIRPVRLVLVGAGGMGRAWLRTILANPDTELVGVVDLDTALAGSAVTEAGLRLGPEGVVVGTSVSVVAEATAADAVVNVTVPAAHHPVNTEALFAGLPVLCEKPIAPTVAQALSLAATAEASGQLLMTSQSRRYYASIAAFREQVATLGRLGSATTEFFKAPHFGGFREEMAHVLLVDMAIHAFDAARYVLGLDPIAVYCEEYNPGWSWFSADAAATAVFEFAGGVRYTYSGSWCADGMETSWNGSWRVNGEHGAAVWDGDSAPQRQLAPQGGSPSAVETAELEPDVPEEIAGSLVEFVDALRTGRVPSGEVHANVLSLAMVEAAVRSAESGERVVIADVLAQAHAQAIETEPRADVRGALVASR